MSTSLLRFLCVSAGAGALCIGAAPLALSLDASTDGKIAIKTKLVITQAGEPIQGGVIVIEDGRIQAVGTDIEIPWDAEVLDKPELVAFPGFVEAYTSRGMDRPNENIDVAPFLSVRDSLDPVNIYFQDSLRWGVVVMNVQQGPDCVIGAQGMVVKPYGMTVEEMMLNPGAGLRISVGAKTGKSRATQLQVLRSTFADLRRTLEGLVQDRRDDSDRERRTALAQGRDPKDKKPRGQPMKGSAWKVEGLELVPRESIDEKLLPLLELVEGNMRAFIHCPAPMNVEPAIALARENGFLASSTLVIGNSCWKAAEAIAQADVPVILMPPLVHVERDPMTGKEIETFVPGELKKHGVRFALSSANSSTESLWYQAARSIGLGLDRQSALDAVTVVPARILGLEERVGSIGPGRDGNVVLYSGDPLSVSSWVEYVILDGNVVYDRSQDVRAKHLLEGLQPPGTASTAETSAEMEHDEHGEEQEEGDEGDKDEDEEDDDGGEEDPEVGS